MPAMQSTIWMALTSFHVTFQQSVIVPIDRQAAVDVPPYSPEKFKGGSTGTKIICPQIDSSTRKQHATVPPGNTRERVYSRTGLQRLYRQPAQRRLRRLGKCYGKATTTACHACSQKLYDNKHGVSLQRDALLQLIRSADALPPSAVACCGSCITAFGIRSACG